MPIASDPAPTISRTTSAPRAVGGHRGAPFAARLATIPLPLLYAVFFVAVALSHWTLLRLPYFWDEGGYYIPAAFDFYRTGTLIPQFTNAHPPLPNVVIGTLWHIVGVHILPTRLLVCAFAAAGLLAVYRLARAFLKPEVALTVAFLTAVYPIWFAQSSLAHADIFAAAFTLWAFALYLPGANPTGPELSFRSPAEESASLLSRHRRIAVAALFCLAALSKETAVVEPAALAGWHFLQLIRNRRDRAPRREHLRWLAALLFPILPLALWYAYHHARTGFTFGNPEFLHYNATANFSAAHIFTALRFRFLHLFWQRNIWVPLVLAAACLFLPHRGTRSLPRSVLTTIAILVAANWLAFSILGGALLTRYLLPVYPLILLVCVAIWQERTHWWPALAAFTAVAFITALWFNPPTAFAPEDNLVYRDMVVVHQGAINFVAQHYPDARILTAWPVAADLFRPELGYVTRPMHAVSIENFTLPEIRQAATDPGRFDTAIVFTTHYLAPEYRAYLVRHPNSARGREFATDRDLTPAEIASILHGRIVWQDDRRGEWAAVLRFDRSYEASLTLPAKP